MKEKTNKEQKKTRFTIGEMVKVISAKRNNGFSVHGSIMDKTPVTSFGSSSSWSTSYSYQDITSKSLILIGMNGLTHCKNSVYWTSDLYIAGTGSSVSSSGLTAWSNSTGTLTTTSGNTVSSFGTGTTSAVSSNYYYLPASNSSWTTITGSWYSNVTPDDIFATEAKTTTISTPVRKLKMYNLWDAYVVETGKVLQISEQYLRKERKRK